METQLDFFSNNNTNDNYCDACNIQWLAGRAFLTL
jgi:hypothetical protein